MARLPRAVLPGELHLIVHRGQRGRLVFLNDDDRRNYLAALRTAATDARTAIHAYALLADEVRLLLTPATSTSLADLMQSVGRRYVRVFNQTHGRTGTPWEGRFRSTIVSAEQHFLQCLRFVEGVASSGATAVDAAETKWSSAAHHLVSQADPLISEHPAFWALGNTPFEREASYRRITLQPLPSADVELVHDAVLKGWALGPADFVARVHEETGRRSQRAARGRPKKRAAT